MSWSFAVDIAMVGLLLVICVFTIAVRDAFAAVIAFAAYGLLVAVVWVRLQAVDVALTEAAIGSGLTGVLMLGAAARLRGTERAAQAERVPAVALARFAAVLSAAVAAALGTAVLVLRRTRADASPPPPRPSSARPASAIRSPRC